MLSYIDFINLSESKGRLTNDEIKRIKQAYYDRQVERASVGLDSGKSLSKEEVTEKLGDLSHRVMSGKKYKYPQEFNELIGSGKLTDQQKGTMMSIMHKHNDTVYHDPNEDLEPHHYATDVQEKAMYGKSYNSKHASLDTLDQRFDDLDSHGLIDYGKVINESAEEDIKPDYPNTPEGARKSLEGDMDTELLKQFKFHKATPDHIAPGIWKLDYKHKKSGKVASAIVYMKGYPDFPSHSPRKDSDFECDDTFDMGMHESADWTRSYKEIMRDHPDDRYGRDHDSDRPGGFVDTRTGEHIAPAPHSPEIIDIPPKPETVQATERPKLKQDYVRPRGWDPRRDGPWD